MLSDTALGLAVVLVVVLPLAFKWQLAFVRVVGTVVALTLAASAAVGLLGPEAFAGLTRSGMIALLTLVLAGAGLAFCFYRDPHRVAPTGTDIIVSPADGKVVYVRESRDGSLPVSTKGGREYTLLELTGVPLAQADAVVIGISMSLLDVHVNRAPISGRVTLRRHLPGRFGSLRHPEMVFENERATTVIENDHLQVAVVQIASRLVRQIVGFVSEGTDVSIGQRIGVIRLGSQVDVVLPSRWNVRVEACPGQRLRAGETVLASLARPARPPGLASRVAADEPHQLADLPMRPSKRLS